MAASAKVDEDKQPLAASLLPVTKAKKKQAPLLPAVLLVSLWALLNFGFFLACGACNYALNHYHIHLPPWMTDPKLTGAAAAEKRAIRYGVMWSSTAAFAAAALVLLLPGRRRRRSRRALAYVALAAIAATHLMTARVVTLVLTTDPGDIIFRIASAVDFTFFAAGDIICFMALLGRGAYAIVPC